MENFEKQDQNLSFLHYLLFGFKVTKFCTALKVLLWFKLISKKKSISIDLNNNGNEALKEINENLIVTNNKIKEELEKLNNKSHKIELKVKIIQDERDSLQQGKVQLESKIQDLEKIISDKNNNIQKLENLISENQKAKHQELKKANQSLISLENSNQTLKELNKSLLSTNNKFKEELEILKNHGHETDSLLKKINQEKFELESIIKDLQNLVSDKNNNIRTLEDLTRAQRKVLSTRSSRIEELKSENTKLANAGSTKQQELQEANQSLMNSNKALKEVNKSLMSTNHKFKEELETLKSKRRGYKMELLNLYQKIDQMKIDSKMKADLETKVKDLENQVSVKNDDIKKMKEITLRDIHSIKILQAKLQRAREINKADEKKRLNN